MAVVRFGSWTTWEGAGECGSSGEVVEGGMGGDEDPPAAVGDSRDEKREVDDTTESLTDPESRFDMLSHGAVTRPSQVEAGRASRVGRSRPGLPPLHTPPELILDQSTAHAATHERSCSATGRLDAFPWRDVTRSAALRLVSALQTSRPRLLSTPAEPSKATQTAPYAILLNSPQANGPTEPLRNAFEGACNVFVFFLLLAISRLARSALGQLQMRIYC